MISMEMTLALLLANPLLVMAHAGHSGHEFQDSGAASGNQAIAVDASTVKRLDIKIEPVKARQLDVGLKTTGQIEMLPDRHAEVTAPVPGKIVKLLVQPGAVVRPGQPLATMTSAELSDLRVSSQEKRAEAVAGWQQAQVDLKLAQENYQRYLQIANAEIAQARSQLAAAQAQYQRDRALVNGGSLVKIAKTNYQQQVQIAQSEIEQAQIEIGVAQERYDRDRQLVASGAIPRRQMLESQAQLAAAKSQLAKAKSRPEVLQAQTEVRKAEVDLPIRQLQESAGKLAEAQAGVTKASTKKDAIAAEAQLKRARSAVTAARTKLELSDRSYQTRLQQLGTSADRQGLVSVVAPIGGTIAERAVTLGQSVQDRGTKLMSIVNDLQVLATANIYERDLGKVRLGQKVNVRVASLPDRLFTGTINRIGTVVGEGRVVPVQVQLDNSVRLLKPGMFAELEVVTDRTAKAVLAIPTAAIVEANGKQLVYVQSGDTFQAVEVSLGQITGDLTEVKTGLFAGDRVVLQGGMLLYAQSLRGGNQTPTTTTPQPQLAAASGSAWWWWAGAGGTIAASALGAVTWALLRRRKVNRSELAATGDRWEEQAGSSPLAETSEAEFTTTSIARSPAPASDLHSKDSSSASVRLH